MSGTHAAAPKCAHGKMVIEPCMECDKAGWVNDGELRRRSIITVGLCLIIAIAVLTGLTLLYVKVIA